MVLHQQNCFFQNDSQAHQVQAFVHSTEENLQRLYTVFDKRFSQGNAKMHELTDWLAVTFKDIHTAQTNLANNRAEMNAALHQLAHNVTTIHGAVAGQHSHLESTAGMIIKQVEAVGKYQRATDELSARVEAMGREVKQVLTAMESVQE